MMAFIILVIFMIVHRLKLSKVVQYLKSNDMQEELDLLEIGHGNGWSRLSMKKFKIFYTTRTEDKILNCLKEDVCKNEKLVIKIFIAYIIFAVVSFFLMLILGLAICGIPS